MRLSIWIFFFLAVLTVGSQRAGAQSSLTPDEAVRLALDRNESIRMVRAEAEAADAAFRQVRSARFPTLSTQAGYTRLSDNIPEIAFDTDFLPGLDTSFTLAPVALDRYYSEISLEQPLFAGFRLHYQIEAARHRAEAADLAAAREEDDLALRVLQAYWHAYQAAAARDAAEQAQGQVEAHLADVENRRQAGAALQSDVLTVQTRLSEVKLERLEAENGVRLSRVDLNRLLGLPLDADVALTAELEVVPIVADLPALVNEALASRSALDVLTAQLDAMEADVYAARGSWFPQLALNGRYVYARPNQYFFTEQDAFKATWEAGVSVRWSLWDGGTRSAETREARARLEGASARLDAARQDVAVDVTRRYLEVQRAVEAIAVTEQAVAQADEALRMIREQYARGAALSADVLDAEQASRVARARTIRGRADYAVARAALEHAVGRIR